MMPEIKDFLENLTLILVVSAAVSFVFYKLRQPLVLGYILAGMIMGPHIPIPLVADKAIVHTLSELGIIFLMFSLGLEFSPRKLIKVLPLAGLVTLIECTLMIWLGYVMGRALGWTPVESFYAGAIVAISSTVIIAKTFSEQKIRGKVSDLVFGVLIVEDLIAILLLAGLPVLVQSSANSGWELAKTASTLFMFLITLLAGGSLIIPRILRSVMRSNLPEITLVVSVGICFAFAILAKKMGYSVALGAFLAGSLMAESGEEGFLGNLIRPVRDLFVAVFFVSVGMLIDPFIIAKHWPTVLGFTVLVILGKFFGVTVGSFLAGYSSRLSIRAGVSMTQIGEFSFIIAGMGVLTGSAHSILYPLAVAVSALTTLTTPWLIRFSDPIANWVDRIMPHRLQIFTTLYETWIQRLRQSHTHAENSRIRRFIWLILLDVICLCCIILGAVLSLDTLIARVTAGMNFPPLGVKIFGILTTLVITTPFVVGMVHCIRALGLELTGRMLPKKEAGKQDLSAIPRRMLMITLQFALVLLFGFPLLILTQPFVPPYLGITLLTLVLALLGIFFWRGTTQLQGHVQAGAQRVVEMFNKSIEIHKDVPVIQPEQFLPWLGKVHSVRIEPNNHMIGKTLGKINLRSLTGASIIAITRGGKGVVVPTGEEKIYADDVLAITGTDDAVQAAKEMLCPVNT